EVAVRNQSPNELTVRVEDIDETVARARFVIVLVGQLLLCEGYKNLAAEIADSKWRVPGRKIWISEREATLEDETLVVSFDLTSVKIRHVKKIMTVGDAHGRAFINCATGPIIHRFERMGAVEVWVPARYHAVF